MSYTTTDWQKGDTVSAAKLNNMENGIWNNDDAIATIQKQLDLQTCVIVNIKLTETPIENQSDAYVAEIDKSYQQIKLAALHSIPVLAVLNPNGLLEFDPRIAPIIVDTSGGNHRVSFENVYVGEDYIWFGTVNVEIYYEITANITAGVKAQWGFAQHEISIPQ